MTHTMHRKRRFAWLIGSVAVLLLLVSPIVKADKIKIQPMFTYGESLSASQFNETKRLLKVEEGTEEIPVQINELNGLLHDNYPYQQVYSSSYITPANNDGGVTVQILTPDTITAITPRQYENAAITAGAVDVNIDVASAVPVDGSGALAGVYKAFASSGQALNSQSVEVAQEELETAAQITEDNKDKEGYSDENLNAAIADIKEQIQQYKDENGGNISVDQIQVIVNNVVNNYNLTNILSEENINQIQQLMQRFSEIELTDEQKNALNQLGDRVREAGNDIADKAQQAWNDLDDSQKQEINGIWDQIVQTFRDIWNNIVSIFQ
ncbi:MAG: DUF1002 domain-containing protein [Aerococcus sp.]|nr:DUF1002 domain-containing protein [Aerococcus sp.]